MAPTGESTTQRELVRRAVDQLARVTGFPVSFGGLEHDGAVAVSATAGTRTRMLDDLVVRAERGLGGRTLVEKRPRLAVDYRTSRAITHDYDRAVLGEGITTLLAIPVLVQGRARGVLYCGSWREQSVGDAVARPAFAIAQSLATEMHVREEVERRVANWAPPAQATLAGRAQEELRESYAELRSIAASVDDPLIRERLNRVEARLATLSTGQAPSGESAAHLSPREIDVLACVALGSTNAQIAQALGIREGTVKSYLQSAMIALNVSTRHAAVAQARRAGILP